MTKADEVIDALRALSFRCFCGEEHYGLSDEYPGHDAFCLCGRIWAPRGDRPLTETSCYAFYLVGRLPR